MSSLWAALALLVAAALAACLPTGSSFVCQDTAQCGPGGTCEPAVGFCSFADTGCASGRRFGEFSGDSSNRCVEPDEAPVAAPPSFVAEEHTHRINASAVAYAFATPGGDRRYLLVTVQIGASCPQPSSPEITGVTYGGVPLTRGAAILGTPCGAMDTRSEHWGLVAPPTGMHDVEVTLAGTAESVHSSALLFTGVNQTTPVRAFMTASGFGTSSEVTVASAVDDLVVNTVGQGREIVAPTEGMERFRYNINSSNTLNNSAAATMPGAATVTTRWLFANGDDVWQSISSSLRP